MYLAPDQTFTALTGDQRRVQEVEELSRPLLGMSKRRLPCGHPGPPLVVEISARNGVTACAAAERTRTPLDASGPTVAVATRGAPLEAAAPAPAPEPGSRD
ncbi:hypothetical protein CYMTET_21742 [Cymbomonas tetramitiformis]|uniref:Uncharacterized protein n=1 Tax=Cymbomonas tetramitiformis TaxID=36881 RepID=A0AAE0G1K7_9CHLO|nr:hypothetical protein CYMTET_21742 [Cymbomonas tetramitiformis]